MMCYVEVLKISQALVLKLNSGTFCTAQGDLISRSSNMHVKKLTYKPRSIEFSVTSAAEYPVANNQDSF